MPKSHSLPPLVLPSIGNSSACSTGALLRLLALLSALAFATVLHAQTTTWRYDVVNNRWFQSEPAGQLFSDTVPSLRKTATVRESNVADAGIDDVQASYAVISSSDSSQVHLRIYNNLLYDAFLAPNAGLELSLGKNYSVGADAFIAWIERRNDQTWHESYGFDLYGRYWFGKSHTDELLGLHLGIYAGTLTYDLYPDSKGYQCSRLFHTFRTGLEFGYSGYASKKNKNFRVDFYCGLGYLHTRQDVYLPNDKGGYYRVERRFRNLPDITRFGITIGYMFNSK